MAKINKTFHRLRTLTYYVSDMAAAKKWYTQVLGFEPYFDQPFYIGYNVGGFELGLVPSEKTTVFGNNTVVYLGVDDAKESLQRLLNLGAKLHHDIQDVGEGILVGAVLDPFGNIFGVIQNPLFKIEE